MTFIRTAFVLLISLVSLSSQAEFKVENWHPEIRTPQTTVLELVKITAQASIQKISKSRSCEGHIISIYLSPSSLVQNQTTESFKVYYQLSYNRAECSNKLLVTCGALITNSAEQVSISKSYCRSYNVKSYESASGENIPRGPLESPDSIKDSNDNVIDDGITDPRRGGNDVERGYEGDF